MLGLGKRNFNSSMTTIYLCLFILLINQFLIVRSFRLSSSDSDQNELDDVRRALIRRFVFGDFANSDESFDGNDSKLPRVQRRFCCMSPLSGRKRSVRDLAQKQIATRPV